MEIILVALPEELDYRQVSVPVIYTGVGLSNAAVIAYEAVMKYRPSMVINYGSAGALTNIQGLLTVSHVCQRDADCSPLRERGYMLGENILYYTSMHDTDAETGLRCGSGNNFVTDPDAWTRQHCDIVDMELWSIAKVCDRFNIPWISKKWISDNADSGAAASWEENVARGEEEFINWYNLGK
jgi:adenosylhomocysteine nucleosidase